MEFRKMTSSGFEKYLHDTIVKVAKEYTQAGYCKEEDSTKFAGEIIRQYVPESLDTNGQYIFDIIEDNKNVGMIWYGKTNYDEAFICDFIIYEPFRRKGYGIKAMKLLEEHAKRENINKLTLHVFGHNKAAIALYEKMGYNAFSLHMSKKI